MCSKNSCSLREKLKFKSSASCNPRKMKNQGVTCLWEKNGNRTPSGLFGCRSMTPKHAAGHGASLFKSHFNNLSSVSREPRKGILPLLEMISRRTALQESAKDNSPGFSFSFEIVFFLLESMWSKMIHLRSRVKALTAANINYDVFGVVVLKMSPKPFDSLPVEL